MNKNRSIPHPEGASPSKAAGKTMAWERLPSHKIDYAYFVRYLSITTSFHLNKKATKTAPFREHGPSWPFSIQFSPLEADLAIFMTPSLKGPLYLS